MTSDCISAYADAKNHNLGCDRILNSVEYYEQKVNAIPLCGRQGHRNS
ncbi:MAG: hypothetical protein HC785_05645 [Calothrix sp. CSU_2_0]|nr:hypothetical protein [Calothrix sp. CSU_2_0]